MNATISYTDVINSIAQTASQLTLAAQSAFVQNLLRRFVQNLPTDWLDNELDSEKLHYQALFDIINRQTWQPDSIEQALNALDDIMFAMGDSYPHSTSDAILLMLDMLGVYLSLTAMEEKSAVSDGWVILTAEGYLDYYDQLAEDSSENTDDVAHNFDDWLAHPLTQTAFNHVNHALELAKRTCQK
ncbi:hypothetical protein SKB0120_12910 [Moraxella osloensis]